MLAFLTSCGGMKQVAMTPTEVKLMTTKQFENNNDIVYKSVLSLLQAEGFLINNTDKETGMITASKQMDNKNADLSMALLGFAKEASTANISVFVESINVELTEVRMTIYEGEVTSSQSNWGNKNTRTKNSMIQKPEIYTTWFNNLRTEIERRKALL